MDLQTFTIDNVGSLNLDSITANAGDILVSSNLDLQTNAINNAGNINLDSITANAGNILISSNLDLQTNAVDNVGNINLDSLTANAGNILINSNLDLQTYDMVATDISSVGNVKISDVDAVIYDTTVKLNVQSNGDSIIWVEADKDNLDATDNSTIIMSDHGGSVSAQLVQTSDSKLNIIHGTTADAVSGEVIIKTAQIINNSNLKPTYSGEDSLMTFNNTNNISHKNVIIQGKLKTTDVSGDTATSGPCQVYLRSNTINGIVIEADVNQSSISDISRFQMKQYGSTRCGEMTLGSANVWKFFHGNTTNSTSGNYEFYSTQFTPVDNNYNTIGTSSLLWSMTNTNITSKRNIDMDLNNITNVSSLQVETLDALGGILKCNDNILFSGAGKTLLIVGGYDLQLSSLSSGSSTSILSYESAGVIRQRGYFDISSPQYTEVLAEQTTSSSVLQDVINTSTTSLGAGTYKFSLFTEISGDTGAEITMETTFGSHVKTNTIYIIDSSLYIPITINFIQSVSGVNSLIYKIASFDGINTVKTKNSQIFVQRII